MKISFDEKELQDLVNSVADHTSIIPSYSFLAEILSEDKVLLGNFISWGTGDTCFNESIMSKISQKLIGKNWPTYGDIARSGGSFKDFQQEIFSAALKKDFTVITAKQKG